MIVVIIFLFIVGVIIHFVNVNLYIYYYLTLLFFVPYTLSLLLNLGEEEFQILTNYSPIFLVSIFIIELIRNKFRMRNQSALVLIILLSLYILWGILLHGANLMEYIIHFFVSFLAPLFCLSNLFYWRPPQKKRLSFFVLLIFITNVVLSYLQFFTGYMVPAFKADSITMSDASGTLSGGNGFSSYMLLFLFLFIQRIQHRKTITKILVIFLTFAAIVLSGVRTYLVCAIIFIPLFIFISRYRSFNLRTLIFVAVIVILPFICFSRIDTKGYGTGDADNAIQRQIYGLSVFSKGESTDEKSTMYLSFYVFTEYFVNNPLFGLWLLYTPQSYGLVSPENQNVMDAGMAVYLTDIGVVGFILYVLFQLKTFIWNTEKEKHKFIYLLYVYVLLTTYTDIGIFGGAFTCCAFIVCYLIDIPHEKESEPKVILLSKIS